MPLQTVSTDPRPGAASLGDVERRMRSLLADPDGCLTPVASAAGSHLGAGGRRLRARLAVSAGEALGLAPEEAVAAAAAAELLHNASLVHDDLQDGDRARRGAPTVWASHGADVAICTGDMLLSAAFAAAAPLARGDGGRSLARIHRAVAETIRGQVADRQETGRPLADIESYRRLARAKSGPLIALPLELSLEAAGRPEAIEQAARAGRAFALAYQVADDLSDVETDRQRGTVNIVAVLMRAQTLPQAAARAAAARAGRTALAEARAAAAALPDGAGRGLIEAGAAIAGHLKED